MTTPRTIADGEALRRACRDLGLAEDVADALLAKLLSTAAATPAAAIGNVVSDGPPTPREAEMMRLLNTASADRLVHDLRNVLNELVLLKAAAEL